MTNNQKLIYLDNAATTPLRSEVLEAMMPFLTEEFGNPSAQFCPVAQFARAAIDNARVELASCLNAKPDEIFFTSGGTESDNWAIKGVAFANKFGATAQKNHIITTTIEHHAVSHTCEYLSKMGFDITYLQVDSEGLVNPDDLENAITDKTCLVTIIHANNEIGTVQDIKKLAEIAHKHDVIFHTDSVQSTGHLPIDVKDLGVDLLSMSGHKFRGPKGTGVLYVKKGTKLHNFAHGGAQENNKRAGTENVPGIVGISKALCLALEELPEESKRLTKLRDYLIETILKRIPGSHLNGHLTQRLPNNVNVRFDNIEGESILLLLSTRGICASSGSACASASLDPSHVLLAIGLPHEKAHGSLRLSLGDSTTKEDIDYTIDSLCEIVEKLRYMSPIK
ncbi:MAG: cysteine desulfurase NifS [Clostridiales bacterium]|jgi:cysteine desulfurase|nr:cysteine desulfurase NifS [Clostridiales bacterium]